MDMGDFWPYSPLEPSEPFDEFDPGNFDAHADWVADGLVHQMRHTGSAHSGYRGPNYRTILLLAARKLGEKLGRPVTATDRRETSSPGGFQPGVIVLRVADWSHEDTCVCADEHNPEFETVCLDPASFPGGFRPRVVAVHMSRREACTNPN